MVTLDIINSTREQGRSLYQIQVLLDVISAYFDVPMRLVNKDYKVFLEKEIGHSFINLYRRYKNNPSEQSLRDRLTIFLQDFNDEHLHRIIRDTYLTRSSNNSALSFRLELHKEWRLIKLMEDYIALERNSNNPDDFPIEYATNDFFAFTRYCRTLNAHIVSGPFLTLKEKSHESNETAIANLINMIMGVLNKPGGTSPVYGEYLRLGSEYFSCSIETARKLSSLAYKSLSNALTVNIPKHDSGLLPTKDNGVSLGKRNWIFIAYSSIFLSRYESIGPPNKNVTLFHSYNDGAPRSAQILAKIRDAKIDTITYSSSTADHERYLTLEVLVEPSHAFANARKKISDLFYKRKELDIDTRQSMWEHSYISVIKQAEKNINSISDRRIALIEQYLNDNWRKYLIDSRILSTNICIWVNTVLRGVETFLYEYSYRENKLTDFATSSDTNCRTQVRRGLQMVNSYSTKDRSKYSIAYRCIYQSNRQYVHYQSLDEDENAISIPNRYQYFWRTVEDAQSSIAHTLTYNERSLGVIEIQGDHPYFFRHVNIYKLRQLALFFGEYFYRAKANQWLQVIIDSASIEDQQSAYQSQCEALTNLFLASGAGIWVYDSNIGGAYRLKGFYGSDKVNELITLEPQGNFFKINTTSEGATFINQRASKSDKDSFFISKPYSPSFGQQAYKEALIEEGFDHILLFAINSPNKKHRYPQAVVTIHNRTQHHNDDYPPKWGNEIASISRFIQSAFAIMHSVSERERKRTQSLSHDLQTNIGQLEANAINMLRKINRSDKTCENKLEYISFVVENDLKPIVSEARQQIDGLLYGEGLTDKEQFFISIRKEIQDHDRLPKERKYIDFRAAYNKAFENMRNEVSGVYFKPLLGKDDRWKVNISEEHLNRILINLIRNAQKYSSTKTAVSTRIFEDLDHLTFEIANEGKAMEEETEEFKVFEHRFRGTNAIRSRGKGLGLWQVKHILELYGNSIFFSTLPVSGKNFTKYTVRIQFYDYARG